jgi:hypothetical protein
VLEHCREGKQTIGSLFLGAFLSDSVPKATKDVCMYVRTYVRTYFFVRSFTYMDEPIMDKVLSVKGSCHLYQRVPRTFWTYQT